MFGNVAADVAAAAVVVAAVCATPDGAFDYAIVDGVVGFVDVDVHKTFRWIIRKVLNIPIRLL